MENVKREITVDMVRLRMDISKPAKEALWTEEAIMASMGLGPKLPVRLKMCMDGESVGVEAHLPGTSFMELVGKLTPIVTLEGMGKLFIFPRDLLTILEYFKFEAKLGVSDNPLTRKVSITILPTRLGATPDDILSVMKKSDKPIMYAQRTMLMDYGIPQDEINIFVDAYRSTYAKILNDFLF